jgi:acyl-CoA dehydrogenase
MRAAAEPDQEKASIEFEQALFGHIGFTLGNAASALWLGLTGARFVSPPVRGPSAGYYQQITRMSAAFALVADVAMLSLGGALKRKEKLSGRFADILGQMYLASALLKRFEDQHRPPEDVPLMRWACDDALYQTQEALEGLLSNFPQRWMGWLLRRLVFPLGRAYTPPDDRLGHAVAELLLSPSAARDRLTAGLYVPRDMNEPLGRLDAALDKVDRAEVAEKKLQGAVKSGRLTAAPPDELLERAVSEGIIVAMEAELIKQANALRKEVIQVDAFDPAYLQRSALPKRAQAKSHPNYSRGKES